MHDKLKLSLVSQAVPIMKHIVNKCMTGKMHFKISLSAVLFDLIKILVEIGNYFVCVSESLLLERYL